MNSLNFNKLHNKLAFLKTPSFLFFVFLLLILFIPKPSSAFIGTGIFDYFDTALEGVEEIAGPLAKKVISIFFVYVIGLIFLGTSTVLLEQTMNPEWLSIYGNPLVEKGWNFTVNIANMFLVLGFIVIALGIILGRRSLQIKKTLPRLILVAFLINFSLLLVGALLDISNILYNTFWKGNENLPSQVIDLLIGKGGSVLTNMISWLGALALSFSIPFVGPFAQIALVSYLIVAFPTMLAWFFQIICFFIVGGIFLLYGILFAFRVFIVQLLAIISPLAFVAWIFPQTERYFKTWFRMLLQWIFLGIFLIFFLSLGLAGAVALSEKLGIGENPTPIPGLSWFKVHDYFVYYLFLTIYLGIAAALGRRVTPMFVDQALGMFNQAKGAFVGRIGGVSKYIKERARRWAAEKEKEFERKETPKKTTAKIWRGIKKGLTGTIKWAHRIRGTTIEAGLERDIQEKKEKLKERFGNNVEQARIFYGKSWRILPPTDKIAFTLYAAEVKGGKGLVKMGEEEAKEGINLIGKSYSKKLSDVLKYNVKLMKEMLEDISYGGVSLDILVPEREKDKDVIELMKLGYEKADAIKKAAFKKVIDDLKSKDIEKLTDDTLTNPEFQEVTALFKPWGFIRKIGEEWGADILDKIQETAEEIGLEKIAKSNPSFLRAPYTPGGSIFLRRWFLEGRELTRNDIEELIRRAKRGDDEEKPPSSPKPPKPPKPPPKPPRGRAGVGVPIYWTKEKKEEEEEEEEPRGRVGVGV